MAGWKNRNKDEGNVGMAERVQEVEAAEDNELQEELPVEEDLEGEVVDELTALQEELEQVKAQEAEYLDGWQRARAELANARKRFQRDREQAYTNAKADMLVQLLPIADDFGRAFETMPQDLSGEPWIEGVTLVRRKLQLLVTQAGVVPIEAAGEEFDPFTHEAITHEPSDDVPAGHVIAEVQTGYKLGDRVLRPSVVRVSAGPVPAPEDGQATTENEATDKEQA